MVINFVWFRIAERNYCLQNIKSLINKHLEFIKLKLVLYQIWIITEIKSQLFPNQEK